MGLGTEPGAADLPPALLPLLSEATGQWGWWNPNVIERIYAIEAQPHAEWPDDLRESYSRQGDWQPWIDEVRAYYVRRIDRVAGESPSTDADRPRAPAETVTPYGRWLVHPDEGAEWIDIEAGYIVIRQHGDWHAGSPGGLKDLNGRWVVPVSAGYVNMSPLTRTLALGRRAPLPEGTSGIVGLLRWPDGESLFDDLTGGVLHDDGRVRLFHADDTVSAVDATTGEPLFDTRYKNVFAFHRKLRLAVVEWCRPGEPSPDNPGILQGVVHESGRLVIPCEYAHVHHAYKQPPKLLHGRQLLAITADGRPHFYSPDGTLLAALECDMKPWIWTPTVKEKSTVGVRRRRYGRTRDLDSVERLQLHRDRRNPRRLREHVDGKPERLAPEVTAFADRASARYRSVRHAGRAVRAWAQEKTFNLSPSCRDTGRHETYHTQWTFTTTRY